MSFVGVCLVAFFVALLGSIPMAGPVAVLVLSRAAGKKFDEALRIAIGSAVAEGCYAALAFWGITTFLARHKAIIPVSHAVTALVLAGLGVRFVFWKAKDEQDKKRDEGSKKYGSLFEGFAFTAINPTLLLTWSGATTVLYARGILKPHAPAWLTAPYGVCACLGVVTWWLLVTFLMRKYEDKFKRSLLTWVVRGVGILLIFLGVWSGVELVLLLTGKKHEEVTRSEVRVRSGSRSREIWTRTTPARAGGVMIVGHRTVGAAPIPSPSPARRREGEVTACAAVPRPTLITAPSTRGRGAGPKSIYVSLRPSRSRAQSS